MGIRVSSFKKTRNHITPQKWNNLIKKKETKLIDVRKPFEYNVGTFKNSINPNIENFRDFPKFLKKFNKNDKIAMFCTGGIRSEKASIFLKKKGFKNVYQLKHILKQGTYSMCSGCRKPVSQKERKSLKYVEGISCPKCHDHITHEQKSRFAMRQKQILLAKKSGKRHIFQKEF